MGRMTGIAGAVGVTVATRQLSSPQGAWQPDMDARAQRNTTVLNAFLRLLREASVIEKPWTLGSFSGPFRGGYVSSHQQISCYAFHDWLRSLLFSLPEPSPRSGEKQPRRVTIGFVPRFFCLERIAPLTGGVAEASLGWIVCRNDPRIRHIETYSHIWRSRYGGLIAHNRRTRYARQYKRDHPAATGPTRTDRRFRIRIVKEPEATLLQDKYASDSAGSCRFSQVLVRFP
jgi:hypothetical protein